MALRLRFILSLLIALFSGLFCYIRLNQRRQAAADFTFPWRAAHYLLQGENPYTAIRPEGDYPYQTYFYYPLTSALAALPFAALPPYLAGAAFFGLSSGLLAFALTRYGWRYLPLFAGAPFWVALGVAQWSPLLAAAALLPGLGWLLACKPNIGLAGFIYRPDWRSVAGMLAFGLISLLVLPTWPWDWLAIVKNLEGHPPPALVLPFGPLLLLAALRVRTRSGRLILALSLFPQLLFFYDQLLLWLIPATPAAGLLYSALSWIAFFAWRFTSVDPASGQILRQPTQFILVLIYLPALAMALFRPIIGLRRDAKSCVSTFPISLTPSAGRGIIQTMELKITRWQNPAAPSEDDLRRIYTSEGLTPYSWSNRPGDTYAAHAHDYSKVLIVVRGSITWILPESVQQIETCPGDRIDLPRGVVHAAQVGPQGVTCLEAHF